MTRPRGGIIGKTASATLAAASGMWTLQEAEQQVRAGAWPPGPSAEQMTKPAGWTGSGSSLNKIAPPGNFGIASGFTVQSGGTLRVTGTSLSGYDCDLRTVTRNGTALFSSDSCGSVSVNITQAVVAGDAIAFTGNQFTPTYSSDIRLWIE